MAVYGKICASFPFKLAHQVHDVDVAFHDGRVVPSGLVQGRREDVLADAVDSIGKIAGLAGPIPRQHFICPSSQQHAVALQKPLKRALLKPIVEVASDPSRWVFNDAVERHQGGFDDLPHGYPSFRWALPVILAMSSAPALEEARCSTSADGLGEECWMAKTPAHARSSSLPRFVDSRTGRCEIDIAASPRRDGSGQDVLRIPDSIAHPGGRGSWSVGRRG